MKRIICVLVVLSMMLSFNACGGGNNDKKPCTEHIDSDNDGKCDECNETLKSEDNGDDGDETPGMISITDLDYKIVCESSNLYEMSIAEDLVKDIKDKTGKALEIINKSEAEDAEFKILFGRLTSIDESKSVYEKIKIEVTSETSAFSITYAAENVLVVTATNNSALELAADKLLTYIKDGKLLISETLKDSNVVVTYSDGAKLVPFSELASATLISSVRVSGKKIDGLESDADSYSLTFPATSAYPSVSAKAINELATVTVVQAADNNGMATITVTSADLESEKVYTIDFTFAETVELDSSVVNKDGRDGVVTFVFDDGDKHTADILLSNLLPKYDDVRATFGLITKYLAGYQDDGNGLFTLSPTAYSLDPVENSYFEDKYYTYNYEFWIDVLAYRDGMEILSHGHDHEHVTMQNDPVLELRASRQIIKELLGIDTYAYVLPFGTGPANTSNPLYNEYFDILIEDYIGARGTQNEIVTWEWFKNIKNRLEIPAKAVQRFNTNSAILTDEGSSFEECIAAGISNWTDHIDEAIKKGGWAGFCLHTITEDGDPAPSKWDIYESQADELFKYAQNLSDQGRLWIATYTEAQIYYNEWSTANIKTILESDKKITVTLTDEEKNNEIYNMPLTIKVSIPLSWTTASFEYQGNTGELVIHEDQDGGKFVYVNAVPDVSSVIITE